MLTTQDCIHRKAKPQWYPFVLIITLAFTSFALQFSGKSLAQDKPAAPIAVVNAAPPLKPCPPVAPVKEQVEKNGLKLSAKLNSVDTEIATPNADKTDAATKELPCIAAPIIVPHIAVFLPLANKSFANVAEAVKVGFTTAAVTDGAAAPAYRIYAVDNEGDSLAAAYHKAAAEGAVVAVAALTRDGATRIAKEGGSLPTLALNAPAADVGTPKLFYYLSLGIDAEARQVAQLAVTDGFGSAIIVASNAALAKRVRESFEREFVKLGREIKAVVTLSGDAQDSTRVRQGTERIRLDPTTDMIFLALDVKSARALRPYLPSGIPVYATSMAFDARAGQLANLDIESMRLLEMPWSVQPDHPAVMIYARPDQNFSAEQERLYALGVDAWRVAAMLATTPPPTSANRLERQVAPLDGVTGKLNFDMTTRQFTRTLTAVEMRNGRPYLYRGDQ